MSSCHHAVFNGINIGLNKTNNRMCFDQLADCHIKANDEHFLFIVFWPLIGQE